MSRLPITNIDPTREQSQEKYQYPTREFSNHSTYPYNGRYIQGEPNFSSWQSLHTHAMPAVIAPHEIHPYATADMQLALMGKRRKPSRGDSEYVKRPRRRAEEVDRQYRCSWQGCDKAYGALNHLNTHVRNANHGPKREPRGSQSRLHNLIFRIPRHTARTKGKIGTTERSDKQCKVSTFWERSLPRYTIFCRKRLS